MDINKLIKRQPFFVTASLINNQVFCIDDRASDNGIYIKMPGGLPFMVDDYDLMSLNEGRELGCNVADETEKLGKILIAKGLKFGVHSDKSSDPGSNVLADGPKSIGCGYISHRREIMASIGSKGPEIIDELEGLMPELFAGKNNKDMAVKLTRLNGQLSANNSYFDVSPRQVAKAAIDSGAPSMNVKGKHDPNSVAIINTVPDTTYDNNQAIARGLPAYDYDYWAFNEVLDLLSDQFRWSKEVQQLSALIDFIGTVKFLGVKDIFVRR
jgi:hypothetical protein